MKNMFLYIVSGIIGLVALYAGLADKKMLFITSPRIAVIVLTIIGFLMCNFGSIGLFVSKAPLHPLTIIGCIMGLAALLAGIICIFNINIPFVNEPNNALILIGIIIALKFIIARLGFLLPVK